MEKCIPSISNHYRKTRWPYITQETIISVHMTCLLPNNNDNNIFLKFHEIVRLPIYLHQVFKHFLSFVWSITSITLERLLDGVD